MPPNNKYYYRKMLSEFHRLLITRVVTEGDNEILYPGERVLQTRTKNLADGIPVIKTTWDEILLL